MGARTLRSRQVSQTSRGHHRPPLPRREPTREKLSSAFNQTQKTQTHAFPAATLNAPLTGVADCAEQLGFEEEVAKAARVNRNVVPAPHHVFPHSLLLQARWPTTSGHRFNITQLSPPIATNAASPRERRGAIRSASQGKQSRRHSQSLSRGRRRGLLGRSGAGAASLRSRRAARPKAAGAGLQTQQRKRPSAEMRSSQPQAAAPDRRQQRTAEGRK